MPGTNRSFKKKFNPCVSGIVRQNYGYVTKYFRSALAKIEYSDKIFRSLGAVYDLASLNFDHVSQKSVKSLHRVLSDCISMLSASVTPCVIFRCSCACTLVKKWVSELTLTNKLSRVSERKADLLTAFSWSGIERVLHNAVRYRATVHRALYISICIYAIRRKRLKNPRGCKKIGRIMGGKICSF